MKQVKGLSSEEIERSISELEHAYADLLADGSDYTTLNSIWKEIQQLKAELLAREH